MPNSWQGCVKEIAKYDHNPVAERFEAQAGPKESGSPSFAYEIAHGYQKSGLTISI